MRRVAFVIASWSLAAAVAAQPAGDADASAMHAQMHALFHEDMQRIHAIADPEERRRLMHEHMENMREGMAMMNAPAGEAALEDARRTPCAARDEQCRLRELEVWQRRMERRVALMQRMVERMSAQIATHEATDDTLHGGASSAPPEIAASALSEPIDRAAPEAGDTSAAADAENHEAHH